MKTHFFFTHPFYQAAEATVPRRVCDPAKRFALERWENEGGKVVEPVRIERRPLVHAREMTTR